MPLNYFDSITADHQALFGACPGSANFGKIGRTVLGGRNIKSLLIAPAFARQAFSRLQDYKKGSLSLQTPEKDESRRFIDLRLEVPTNPYADVPIRNLYIVEADAVYMMVDPPSDAPYRADLETARELHGAEICREKQLAELAGQMQLLSQFCLGAAAS